MNKQELIKHFEEMEYVSIVQMGKKAFIDMIEFGWVFDCPGIEIEEVE